MDEGYDTGFRLKDLSRATILVGVVLLVGIPVVVVTTILLAGEDFGFAFYTGLILLYYLAFGAYAYARWGRAFPPRTHSKQGNDVLC